MNKKGKAEAFPSGQRDIRLLVGGYGLLDKLQELVNQGEIYSYLLKLETRAKDAEFDQIEKWLASDKEYLLAVKNDDFMKRTQLYNAFQEQARELILDSIIFV